MWKVTVVYKDGATYFETLKDDRAMIEFAQNVETDFVDRITYQRLSN